MVGTISRTARVSGVTRNLKEAAGKPLARRTGIAYEADAFGQEGTNLQNPITIREGASVYAAGIWGEGHAHYPGRSVSLPVLPASRGVGMGWQKSAEAIRVGVTNRQRAEREVRTGALNFDDDRSSRRPG